MIDWPSMICRSPLLRALVSLLLCYAVVLGGVGSALAAAGHLGGAESGFELCNPSAEAAKRVPGAPAGHAAHDLECCLAGHAPAALPSPEAAFPIPAFDRPVLTACAHSGAPRIAAFPPRAGPSRAPPAA